MRTAVLLQIKIEINNSNIDDAMKEFPTLRKCLQEFKRTRSGMFISRAAVLRENNKDIVIKNSIDLRNSLISWEFNERRTYSRKGNEKPTLIDGDSKKFFEKYPKGFHFKCYKVCDL